MKELLIKSSIDHQMEPSLFYEASRKYRPLLVVLHTWSFNRFNQKDIFLPYAKELDWNLLLPEFRGPNTIDNPRGIEACGSKKAKQDIVDAINYVKDNKHINQREIFLFGNSGGGHMALLMAAYSPTLFKGILANCSVTDIEKWRLQNINYTKHIEHCLQGPPSADNINLYHERSPIYHIDKMCQANLKICHGLYDESVPYTHSKDLYQVIKEKDPTTKITFEATDMGHEFDHDKVLNYFISLTNEKTTFSKGGHSVISK